LDFNSLDQNLLYLTVPNAKYFAFRPRSYVFNQNPLDLIGFLVVAAVLPYVLIQG
jgi:hypothetical protein